MFINFDTTVLFGAPDLRLTPLAQRKLLSTNSTHMKIYIEAQHVCLTQHNYFSRINRLQGHPTDDLVEALDRTHTCACLYVKAKLPHYPHVPYLPAIANARNFSNILKTLSHQHKHHIDFSDQLREPILRHNKQFKFPQSLDECKVRYEIALKDLKALERSERNKYLAENVEAHANQGEVTTAQCLKQLKQANQCPGCSNGAPMPMEPADQVASPLLMS
jgi:hypothetical protein